MTTLTYSIPDITCKHCLHTIKMEVGDLPGVQSVAGSVSEKTVTLTFEMPATEAQIKALLAEINYPVAE